MTPADLARARKLRERREELRTNWRALRLDRQRLDGLRKSGVQNVEREEDWEARRAALAGRVARWRQRRDHLGAELERRYRRAARRLCGRPQGELAVLASILFWDIYAAEKALFLEPSWVREARNAIDETITDIDSIEVGVALVRCGWSPRKAAVRLLVWDKGWEARAEEVRAELADAEDTMGRRMAIRRAAREFAERMAVEIEERAGGEMARLGW